MKHSVAAFAVLVLIVGSIAIVTPKQEPEAPRRVVAAAAPTSTTSTTEAPTTTTTTEPPAPEVVAPAPNRIEQNNSHREPAAAHAPPSGDVWDALAQCESGGNWSIDTGNGYSGGLQIAGHEAATLSKASQIEWAQEILARQGWGAWPACSSRLGLR